MQGMGNAPSSYLPVKINMSGVMGPVFASSIMMLPAFLTKFIQSDSMIYQRVMAFFTYGTWSYVALFAALVVFFSYFQTAIVFNSEETANNLKNAGGYQKAYVRTRNLLFLGLEFETVAMQQRCTPQQESECSDSDTPAESAGYDCSEGTSTNYGLIAYEWVSSHLISINQRFNEEIAKNREELLIPSEELPHPDSWFDICTELKRNGFAEACIREEGIEVNLPL